MMKIPDEIIAQEEIKKREKEAEELAIAEAEVNALSEMQL